MTVEDVEWPENDPDAQTHVRKMHGVAPAGMDGSGDAARRHHYQLHTGTHFTQTAPVPHSHYQRSGAGQLFKPYPEEGEQSGDRWIASRQIARPELIDPTPTITVTRGGQGCTWPWLWHALVDYHAGREDHFVALTQCAVWRKIQRAGVGR